MSVIILLLLTILTWRHLPTIPFQGEGFYYFEKLTTNFKFHFPLPQDVFARLLFNFITPIFMGHLDKYMYLLFVVMLVIDLALYVFIRVTTGNKLAAFLTAFLFSVSYVGNYDMYSSGGYQYFAQRASILLPLLASLMFFLLYFLRNFQFKYYLISITVYLFGVAMGFFGTWFLPPFIFYPYFYLLFNLGELKKKMHKVIWVPLPFLVGNYLLISDSLGHYNQESFLSYLIHNPNLLPNLIQQLVVISLPPGIYELPIKFLHLAKKTEEVPLLGLLTFIVYGLALIYIWKLKRASIVLAATAILSIVLMSLFNLYLNSANVLFTFGSSRYFYYPSVFVAVFWGLFLTSLQSPKKGSNLFLVTFCVMWFAINNIAIQRNLADDEWRNRANTDTINYLRLWSKDLKQNPSYVFLPANLGGYGATFAFRYFSHPDGIFRLQGFNDLDLPALAKAKIDPNTLYVLTLSIKDEQVFDKTDESRRALSDLEKKIDEKN